MEFIFVIMAIAVIFIYFFRKDLKDKFIPRKDKYYTIDDQFNSNKKEREKEIDELLAKMGKNGINDLTEKDRLRLNELSKK